MINARKSGDGTAYRLAGGITTAYSGILSVAFWYGPLQNETLETFILQCTVITILVNVGAPSAGNMMLNDAERKNIFNRSIPLALTLGVGVYFGIYALAINLYHAGLPGMITWFLAIIISGYAALLVTFLVLGTSGNEKPTVDLPSHVGALRTNETWIRGAKIEPAPSGQPMYQGLLSVGGIPLDWNREVEHTIITGASGTGKTQVAEAFLRAIRERAQLSHIEKPARAIILDPGGSYYSKFGQPGDVLLNPFDGRSVAWSPFAEIKGPEDFKRIAAAFNPLAEGSGREWSDFGRKTMADTMRAMVKNGDKNPQELFRLLDGSADNLAFYMNNAGIYGLTGEANMTMFSNAKGTIAPNIEIFEYLKPDGDFSVRDWVRKGDENGDAGWLFITYRDDQMKLLRQFVAAMADLAILEGLSLTSNEGLPDVEHRRLFYFMDELDSIGVVSELKDALIKLRKFGGCCVLGLQTISQLRAVYGKDTSGSILGNVATNVVLRPQDGETAEEMSKLLGEQDIERETVSLSQSTGRSRPNRFFAGSHLSTGKTSNQQRQVVTRRVVLASELQNMENLHGILKRPNSPHHPFKLDYVDMPRVNAPFVEREHAFE